ncbi:MAG: hypothetical protein WBE80_13540, partial [Methylocella sp.]
MTHFQCAGNFNVLSGSLGDRSWPGKGFIWGGFPAAKIARDADRPRANGDPARRPCFLIGIGRRTEEAGEGFPILAALPRG